MEDIVLQQRKSKN